MQDPVGGCDVRVGDEDAVDFDDVWKENNRQ